MRLLAMYANARNWYAAPEHFGPDLSETIYPVSFIALILKNDRTKGISGFVLSFVVTEID
jgi:hypothetical protein